jgi:hypothetical protein
MGQQEKNSEPRNPGSAKLQPNTTNTPTTPTRRDTSRAECGIPESEPIPTAPVLLPPIHPSTKLTSIDRKRTRRSTRKKPSEITLYYCNINGFQSKKESIRKIVDDIKPKIIVLCETKLSTGSTVKSILPEYEVCCRPTKAGKRGLAICVKLQTFKSILDVTTTPNNDILAVRIGMVQNSQ